MNIKPEGPCCPVSSHLRDVNIPWIPAEETNVAKTFAREVAKMRGETKPFIADDYADVERHHYMMFPGGFER